MHCLITYLCFQQTYYKYYIVVYFFKIEIDMEFVTTIRGARSLILEGYRYIINGRGRDDRIFWRCAISRSCSGGFTTIKNEIVSSRAGEHSHPPDGSEMIAYKP